MENNENKQQISIELRPDVAAGTYSNFAIISHSKNEFVLDFASVLPGAPRASVNSRVIMLPEHAKRLLLALQDNLQKYEANFGKIELEQQPKGTFNLSDFQGNTRS